MNQPGFWEKVAENPKAVLASQLGLNLPPQVNVHVLDEKADIAYLVLHRQAHLQGWQPPAAVMGMVRTQHW